MLADAKTERGLGRSGNWWGARRAVRPDARLILVKLVHATNHQREIIMPTKKTASKKTAPAKPAKVPPARMSLKEVMAALEKNGSAQTRKTYARHGAADPMFGVSFGYLKTLVKRIKVDQELAEALWDTGNFDARNLASKVCDPANIAPKVLDAWAATPIAWLWGGYVGQIAAEGPPGHGRAKADKWLASKDAPSRSAGWCAVGAMAIIRLFRKKKRFFK